MRYINEFTEVIGYLKKKTIRFVKKCPLIMENIFGIYKLKTRILEFLIGLF